MGESEICRVSFTHKKNKVVGEGTCGNSPSTFTLCLRISKVYHYRDGHGRDNGT